MSRILEKEIAHTLIDSLPENATWEDLIKKINVREAIENGLTDIEEGRFQEVVEVRAKYGLK